MYASKEHIFFAKLLRKSLTVVFPSWFFKVPSPLRNVLLKTWCTVFEIRIADTPTEMQFIRKGEIVSRVIRPEFIV